MVPLLRIEPLNAGAPDLRGVGGLIFTSANAIDAFAATGETLSLPVFSVGDATASAARAQGYVKVISANGDITRLAVLIRATPSVHGAMLLHPCALQPAGDLQALLADVAKVRAWPVYRALETGAPAPHCDAALVHSPRGGAALRARLADDRPTDLPLVVAISEAAARAIGSETSATVVTAASPNETAMIEALETTVRS